MEMIKLKLLEILLSILFWALLEQLEAHVYMYFH